MAASISYFDGVSSSLFATGDDILQIFNPYKLFTPQSYGAKGNGTTDDTPAFQAMVAAIVAYGLPSEIYIPKGVYILQDPDTDPHTSSVDGAIYIPSNAPPIRLHGPSAILRVGPNGVGTSVIRVFSPQCKIDNVQIDQNVPTALNTKSNVGIQYVGTLNIGVDAIDGHVSNVRIYNGLGAFNSYSTGTIVYDHTGGSSERLVTLTGGSFPSWVDVGARIKVGTDWFDVATRINATNITLNTTAGTNPGADVGSTAYEAAAEPLKNAGRDGIQLINTYNCVISDCYFYRVGWNGYRISGGEHRVNNCFCIDQRGNGLRVMDNTVLHVDGFTCFSQHCSGRTCFISDAGSGVDTSPSDNLDVRCQYLYCTRLNLRCTTDGRWEGAGTAFKLGSTWVTRVSNSYIHCGYATNNVSFRVEDCCREVYCDNVDFYGRVLFTPQMFQGIPTTFADNGAGKLNITLPSGHLLVAGKSFIVYKGNSAGDNIEHVVNSVATNVITTNTPYSSSAVGSNIWAHAIADTVSFNRCTFTRSQLDGQNVFLDGFYAYNGEIVDCHFYLEGTWTTRATTKQHGVRFNYTSDRGCNKLRLARCTFSFNSTALCKAFSVTDQDQLRTAGKITSHGHTLVQRGGGTTVLVDTYNNGDSDANYAPNRAIIFNTSGEDPNEMYAAAIPTGTDITFLAGQRIWYTAPSTGTPPGAVCTVGGAVGTWKAMANLA